MPLPSLTLRNVKGSALTFTEMDTNLQNLANVYVASDTTPTLGGNLNPNGFSITANIACDLANNGYDKSLIRFENNNTRENIATRITVLGKTVKAMSIGVLNDDATLVGYGFTPGSNFIEGTLGTLSDLYFFNYGNIYTGVGTTINSTGLRLDSGKSLYINGVDMFANPYGNVQVAAYLTVNPPAGTYSNVQVASYLAGNISVGNIAGKTSGFAIGYRDMPQVSSGNVTLALTDAGKHYYKTATAPETITIPVNSSIAFQTGTVISIINQSTANITLDKGSTSLYLSGNTTSASRTITSYGMATLIKVATDTWFVNGNGVV